MIEVERLSFAYADAPVLRDVSFCTPDGAITALIGPNGSGKSTLLRAMNGPAVADNAGHRAG